MQKYVIAVLLFGFETQGSEDAKRVYEKERQHLQNR